MEEAAVELGLAGAWPAASRRILAQAQISGLDLELLGRTPQVCHSTLGSIRA